MAVLLPMLSLSGAGFITMPPFVESFDCEDAGRADAISAAKANAETERCLRLNDIFWIPQCYGL
jgi:hypothetical protein